MLLLDSEAISALSHDGTTERRNRVRALITEMRKRELPIATVAAVLAEVVRGRSADAQVFSGLKREKVLVLPVDSRVAVRAGKLLGAVRRGSDAAVDAFVVAAAELAGGAVVATVDLDDMRKLAAHAEGVRVVSIQPSAGRRR
jgi:predicted nucleic acid-binding protein